MSSKKSWPGPGPHRELLTLVALRLSSRPERLRRALTRGEEIPRGIKKEVYATLYGYLLRRGYQLAQENTVNKWYERGSTPLVGELDDIAHGRVKVDRKLTLQSWRGVSKKIEQIWLETLGEGPQWRRLERMVNEVWEHVIPTTRRREEAPEDDSEEALVGAK